jgi:D-arginine dehydrogenase
MTIATTADVLVIGAGVVGLTAAAALSDHGKVVVIERESHHGYHSSGRSAAILIDSYGSGPANILTAASRRLLQDEGFVAQPSPILRPRGVLHLAIKGVDGPDAPDIDPRHLQDLSRGEAHDLVPLIPLEKIDGAWLEASAADIDVHALMMGALARLRAHGGQVVHGAGVSSAKRLGQVWRVETSGGVFEAPLVVIAAGAWSVETAALFGASDPVLTPLRRTAALAPVPAPFVATQWPMVVDLAESLYFKPESGGLMISPADETPSPPCDAQPDDMDVAITIDRFERLTGAQVRRLISQWAGLRTFAADRAPVMGFDPVVPGVFWLAGQGGFGVQTAPGGATLAAAMITDPAAAMALSQDWGLDLAVVSPSRPGLDRPVVPAHPLEAPDF